MGQHRPIVGCRRSSWGHDFVSATNRRPNRGSLKMKPAIILVVLAVFLALGAVYLWGPTSTPQGQAALVTLSNVSAFQNAFDADTSVPRLVLLLSPT
jgi:hypothetical protein